MGKEARVTSWIVGALLIALSCCAAVGIVLFRRLALAQEAAAVAAQRYPGEVAYQRFTERSSSIMRVGVWISIAPLAGPVVVLPFVGPVLALAGVPASLLNVTPGPVICLIGFGLLLNVLTFEVLSAALIESQALVRLRGTPSRPADFLALTCKRAALLYLPLALVISAVGLPLAFDQPALLWLAVPAALLWYAPNRVFAVRLQAWLHPTESIERTRWAALEPRIRGWGERASMPISSIRIQRTSRVGSSLNHIAGSRQRTLFLTDLFLENSEWRQQDALVCLALGVARQRGRLLLLPLMSMLYSALIVAVVVAVFGDVVIPGRLSLALPGAPSLSLVDLFFGPVLALLLAGIALALYAYLISLRSRLMLDADRYSATLTGDPLALIVLLHTSIALDGDSRQRRQLWRPRTEERVAALDALMRQPGPRAPWSTMPVPAIAPVMLGPYTLTVPLASAAHP